MENRADGGDAKRLLRMDAVEASWNGRRLCVAWRVGGPDKSRTCDLVLIRDAL